MTAPSLWLETCGDDLTPRPPMTASLSADVAIVGAGFTGLWTAHHLLREDPTLRVVLVERHVAGWGASGRNGGWCSALFPVPWTRIARDHGPDAARRMERALQEVVDEIGEWCRRNGVDADYVKGGTLTLARGPAQLARLRAEGSGQWLDAEEATRRVAAAGVDGGVFNRHCAAIHPGRLVRGLARVVEAQGATIFEGTMATGVHPGRVVTRAGTLRANIVVRATEGYTADIPDSHRLLAPVWSLIIATEPLPHSVWSQIG